MLIAYTIKSVIHADIRTLYYILFKKNLKKYIFPQLVLYK